MRLYAHHGAYTASSGPGLTLVLLLLMLPLIVAAVLVWALWHVFLFCYRLATR